MTAISNPLALIAELTHRCPLHCVYCSNPLELQARSSELSTAEWARVFREAAEAGVLQADFTGGEPLARVDIVELVRAARAAGLYVNLITSGLPMEEAKLARLVEAGLDHIQLSFQGADAETGEEISDSRSHAQKLRVLEWFRQHRIAVTLNFVIHRRNIQQIPAMLEIAEASCATRVELANVQYYGWAFANRENLLPTRAQLDESLKAIQQAQERLKGRIRIEYVVPDYYARFPKPCMGGWGRKLILIAPNGDALPCHSARTIPGLKFVNVKDHNLKEIWEHSEAFERFRGEEWMPEPCKTCDRRGQDFGGCRCQAMLLAGDAAATDPVCSLSPERATIDKILAGINGFPGVKTQVNCGWLYRPNPS